MDIILSSGVNRSHIYTWDSAKRADYVQQAWLDFLTTKELTEDQWTALVDHSQFLGREGRGKAARECARWGHDLTKLPTISAKVCRRCIQYLDV